MSNLIDQQGTHGYVPLEPFEYVHSALYFMGNGLAHNLIKATITLESENKKPYNVFSKPSAARQKAISDGKLLTLMSKVPK